MQSIWNIPACSAVEQMVVRQFRLSVLWRRVLHDALRRRRVSELVPARSSSALCGVPTHWTTPFLAQLYPAGTRCEQQPPCAMRGCVHSLNFGTGDLCVRLWCSTCAVARAVACVHDQPSSPVCQHPAICVWHMHGKRQHHLATKQPVQVSPPTLTRHVQGGPLHPHWRVCWVLLAGVVPSQPAELPGLHALDMASGSPTCHDTLQVGSACVVAHTHAMY